MVLKPKSQNIVQAQVILINKQAKQTLIKLLASSLALFLARQYLENSSSHVPTTSKKRVGRTGFLALVKIKSERSKVRDYKKLNPNQKIKKNTDIRYGQKNP